MPYILNRDRARFRLDFNQPRTAGELNYCVTKLCKGFLDRQGLSYATINEIVGVLECAKMEFYARIARPYENGKIKSNGDVY